MGLNSRGRDDSLNESGSRAYHLAEHGLRTVHEYCAAPTDARDRPGPISDLLDEIDGAMQVLRDVGSDLRGGFYGRQSQNVLDAIASAESVIVHVHIRTHVQEATNSAAELADLRSALARAREDDPQAG